MAKKSEKRKSLADEVLKLVNAERRGLHPLKRSIQTAVVAEKKAADMRDRGYFAHTSPTYGGPGDMLVRHGILWTVCGENIAAGQATPQAVMSAWMRSPGHRANLLSPGFTQLGVGYVAGRTNDKYAHYWVQLFVRF